METQHEIAASYPAQPAILSRGQRFRAPLRAGRHLLGVQPGEDSEGERPAVEAGAEADGALVRVHLRCAQRVAIIYPAREAAESRSAACQQSQDAGSYASQVLKPNSTFRCNKLTSAWAGKAAGGLQHHTCHGVHCKPIIYNAPVGLETPSNVEFFPSRLLTIRL